MAEDITDKINAQLMSLQNQMKDTIKEEEERGTSLEGLDARTKKLEQQSSLFKKTTTETKERMRWKAYKYWIAGGIIILIILIIIWRLL